MRIVRIIALCSACWLAAGAPTVAEQAAPDTSLQAVVAAAATYVRDYQTALTSVLAQEIYQQSVHFEKTQPNRLLFNGPLARTMKSEVFFAFASVSHEWMAIRDVGEVDGRPVENHKDIQTLLATNSTAQVAMDLKNYNARFNIGDILRNFNEPTMSLLVFDDRYRPGVSFSRKSVTRTAGVVLVTIEFTEKKEPTLIHDNWLHPLFSHGNFVIEAETGRIRRAELQATLDPMKFDLTTTYAADEHLGIWMPVGFSERYDAPAGGGREFISGDATYSDFRRFAAKVIIK